MKKRQTINFFIFLLSVSMSFLSSKLYAQELLFDLDKYFETELLEAKGKLLSIKNILRSPDQIFSNLKQYNYFNSSYAGFLTPKKEGIIFNFGYADHGLISKGFSGLRGEIVFQGLEKVLSKEEFSPTVKVILGKGETFLEPAAYAALNDLGLARLINITGAQEWGLKSTLLSKNRKDRRIDQIEFSLEFHLLLVRLMLTPKYQTFKEVAADISPLMARLLGLAYVQGAPVSGFLGSYYEKIRSLFSIKLSKVLHNGKFELDPEYVEDRSLLTLDQARTLLFAISLKCAFFYSGLALIFELSEQGKKLSSEVKTASEGQVRVAKRRYGDSLPGLRDLLELFVVEAARIVNRVKDMQSEMALKSLLNRLISLIFYIDKNYEQLVSEVDGLLLPQEGQEGEFEGAMGFSADELQSLDPTKFDLEEFLENRLIVDNLESL